MTERLTDLQVKMLGALREHRKKRPSRIFSMDDFYESLSDETNKSRFQEDLDILEYDDYVEKVAQAFNEIGSYDIRSAGIKYLRERMDPMDRLDDCKKKLENFQKDLEIIDEAGRLGENYDLAEERITRWKNRLIDFLAQNVSDVEAEILSEKEPVLYQGNRRGSFVATVTKYEIHLSALVEDIEKNPKMIRRESAEDLTIQTAQPTLAKGKQVFVVHGHDEVIRLKVARFLEKGGLDVTILHEKSNKGRTIIEKFEDYSDVAYAVVLLTADDVGGIRSSNPKLQPRGRQNVVFEFGFFMGKLKRNKVCALCEEGLEKPSDIDGLVYIPLDKSGAWKMKLAKELKSAGLDIDLDKAL